MPADNAALTRVAISESRPANLRQVDAGRDSEIATGKILQN
jgi:hypothetical protein